MPDALTRLLLPAGIAALVLASAPAFATSQRTFVASNGNDAGLCSIAAPCRTFATAIAQTNAGGEVIVLDSAGYGPVTISKSVSIIAPAGIYAGISVFSGDGITIAGSNISVILRGLSLTGQGGVKGINYGASSSSLQVDRCTISGMSGHGIFVFGSGNPARIVISGSTLDGNGDSGVEFRNAKAEIHDSVLTNNGAIYSSYAVFASVGAYVSIARSLMAHNHAAARLQMYGPDTGSAQLFIADSVITNNGDGVSAVASGSNIALKLSVVRSQIVANFTDINSIGILAFGGGSGCQVTAFIADNDIEANGGDGVEAQSSQGASVVVRAKGNTVSGHQWGFYNQAATFESLGNNIVRGNSTDKTGVAPITGD